MKRKFLAILTASVMAFSMVTPVFANTNTLPVAGDVVGQGTFTDVDWPDELLGGVLPTTGNLNFVIDPYGHLTLAPGQVITEALRGNEIRFTTPVLGVTSTSSVDVVVTAALRLSNAESATAAPTGVVPLTEAGAVSVSTGDPIPRNVMFWMELNDDVLKTPPAEAAENFTPVGANGLVVPFGAVAVNTLFRLPAIADEVRVYAVSPDLVLERVARTADDRNGTAFRFGGIFNQYADWTVAPDLRVRATFSMLQLHSDEGIAISTDAYGLITAGNNVVDGGGAVVPPVTAARPAIVAPGLRNNDQQAAYDAAGLADTARGRADTARTGALNSAISTFEGSQKGQDDEDALQQAIDTANTALGTARNALTAAQEALTAAAVLDPADVNFVALTTAVGLLDTAVTELADRIDYAGTLIASGPGFIVGGQRLAAHSGSLVAATDTAISFTSDGVGVASLHLDGNANPWSGPGQAWTYSAGAQTMTIRLGTVTPGRTITIRLTDNSTFIFTLT